MDGCVFYGSSSMIGVEFDSPALSAWTGWVNRCTFYGLDICVGFGNQLPSSLPYLTENHATDCAKWIDNLGSGTRTIATIEVRNRLRDITTPRTGIEAVIAGEITTDTGGHETDYVDAPNGDFRLIATAPGYRGAVNGQDLGAAQHAEPTGGGVVIARPPLLRIP